MTNTRLQPKTQLQMEAQVVRCSQGKATCYNVTG